MLQCQKYEYAGEDAYVHTVWLLTGVESSVWFLQNGWNLNAIVVEYRLLFIGAA